MKDPGVPKEYTSSVELHKGRWTVFWGLQCISDPETRCSGVLTNAGELHFSTSIVPTSEPFDIDLFVQALRHTVYRGAKLLGDAWEGEILEEVEVKYCPNHQPPNCITCKWIRERKCVCPEGMYCPSCNRVVMELEIKRGWPRDG